MLALLLLVQVGGSDLRIHADAQVAPRDDAQAVHLHDLLARAGQEARRVESAHPWVLLSLGRAQWVAGDAAGGADTLRRAVQHEKAGGAMSLYRVAGQWQAEMGDLEGARQTLGLAIEQLDEVAGVTPHRIEGYAELAGYQIEAGDADSAVETLLIAAQLTMGLPEEVREAMLWRIARAQVAAGDVIGAAATVEATGDEQGDYELGLWVVERHVQEGNLAAALQQLRGLHSGQDDWRVEEILRSILAAHVRRGEEAQARRRADVWGVLGAKALSRVQVEADDLPGALRTAQEVGDADAQVDVYLTISQALGDKGLLAESLDALRAARQAGDRRLVWVTVETARVQAELGMIEEAEQTVSQVDPSQGGRAYMAIAAAHLRSGQIPAALAFARRAGGHPHDTPLYVDLLEALADAGEAEAVRECLNRIEAHDEPWRPGEELDRALVALVRAGEVDQAARAIELAQDDGGQVGMSRLVGAQLHLGDVRGALRTAEGIPDDPERSEAYERIVKAQVQAEDVPGAQRAAEFMPPGVPRWRAVGMIAAAQAAATDLEAAGRSIETITEDRWRGVAWNRVALALADVGDLDRALSVPDPPYAQLALLLGERRRWAEAIETGEKAAPAAWARTAGALAQFRSRAGDLDGIEVWLQNVQDPLVRAHILLGAARGLQDPLPERWP